MQHPTGIGTVTGIIANLVIVANNFPVAQSEICYIAVGDLELPGEVIKIHGRDIFVQCFESTRGMRVGTKVRFTGEMLEVTLGPGMLSKIYDGLQNDLHKMESLFLQRGKPSPPLDAERRWHFEPLVSHDKAVRAGDWLGEVHENNLRVKIMVPFKTTGICHVTHIAPAGEYGLDDVVAVLTAADGTQTDVRLWQKWPVKRPIRAYAEKVRPFALLETGVRILDSLIPMVEGGTGFIPGAFGTGKTVLQHAISKQARADVVIFAACGERANEIVEVFTEFPKLDDPHTGGKLMDKTIIIANTSNMPVAAREASLYTAMTIAEYYRSMGLKVLILADSTSRWAQALREMSNRLEELPGPDAFPMDLTAVIANYYARAGYVYLQNGQTGSITFLGTVSPSGGNLKEPVTEATKKSARCFYALSQRRADQKRYPAVDPTESYSKYLEYPEVQRFLNENVAPGWSDQITVARDLLQRGREASDQINILGDDGVPLEYHLQFWKAEVLDFVLLQQDAYDPVDALTPMERQRYMLELVLRLHEATFGLSDFEEMAAFFKRLINKLKQLNYTPFQSTEFEQIVQEYTEIANEKRLA